MKLLESSAISISAATSFRGDDLCLVLYQLELVDENRIAGRLGDTETNDKKRQTNGETDSDRQKGVHVRNKKRERLSSGRYMLFVSIRRAKCHFLCCISE